MSLQVACLGFAMAIGHMHAAPSHAYGASHKCLMKLEADLHECSHCREQLDALNRQKTYELETFKQLHAEFQESDSNVMNCLSSTWFKQWEQFVLGRQRDPPGPIDNASIISWRVNDRVPVLRPSADFICVSYDM